MTGTIYQIPQLTQSGIEPTSCIGWFAINCYPSTNPLNHTYSYIPSKIFEWTCPIYVSCMFRVLLIIQFLQVFAINYTIQKEDNNLWIPIVLYFHKQGHRLPFHITWVSDPCPNDCNNLIIKLLSYIMMFWRWPRKKRVFRLVLCENRTKIKLICSDNFQTKPNPN